MAFSAERKTAGDFNGGNEYSDGDVLQAVTINNLVEGLLNAQNELDNVSQGSVTAEELSSAISEATQGLQKSTDDALRTTSKQVVGAINEINEKIGQSSGGLTEQQVTNIVSQQTANLQPKNDENLQTTSKNVVTAINELKNRVDNIGSGGGSGGGTEVVSGLPTVSEADNGKFLRVVNGAWAAATVDSAETAEF
jgi:hypothetical protein